MLHFLRFTFTIYLLYLKNMLDINFIRDNLDAVKAGARKKHIKINLDKLIQTDDKRREFIQKIETMRAEQNEVSKKISSASDSEKISLIAKMQKLKEELKKEEGEFKKIMTKWRELMLQVPNIPDISVPEGKDDEENVEIKTWGEIPKFDFEPKSHIDLMLELGMVDFERGTKVAGFRGYFLKGDGAVLAWAVWQAAQKHFLEKGFEPLMVPSLVRKETLMGTGYIPGGEDDLYKTQDDMYLAGTGEVATMAYHSGETLSLKDLPKKYLAFSPCFRREAGSHGKDTKGLIRVHEFFKWEQVILCEASHEESVKWHEWINRNTEEFVEKLGIPYHTVVNCGGDLGLGQVKKYDIELWVPSENKYREISSASYFHDFQTRRLNIKYKSEDGSRYAHSLNSTAAPTPRFLVSIVENYQQKDGSIKVPELLVPYVGKEFIRKENDKTQNEED